MKKLLAFFLALVMVLPFGMVAQAEETEIKPFYLVTQGRVLEEQTSCYSMPFFWVNRDFVKEDVLTSTWYGRADSYNIPDIARALKEAFDTYPDGTRYINYAMGQTALQVLREDIIFIEEGVEASRLWLKTFLEEYSRIGGKLDGLDVDLELEDLYSFYIESRYSKDDPLCYKKIVDNPIYQNEIRPELEARGFPFYESISDYTPEIYSIHSSVRTEYLNANNIWDAVLRSHINKRVTEACEPLWDYYPEATVTDYQSKNIDTWMKELNDFGGLNAPGGNFTTAGNTVNENYYSTRPYNFFADEFGNVKYSKIPGYNKAVYENRTFNYFLYEANLFKSTYLASDGMEFVTWIGHYMYNLDNENSASLTPYYVEQLYHIGMLNPLNFFGYIIETEVGYAEDYELCVSMVDDVAKDLTRVVGAADRQPIDVEISWNSSFVLSGMNAGGKNVYRITPDTALVSVENFKIEGDDPTFYINGETITFPGGKIIEEANIRGLDENGNLMFNNTCGYWVETAADVKPIVTREADHHRMNPAYGEDYESYEIGTEYNFKNALPATCWEAKKDGNGTATVVADPTNTDNKVLALTGNYTLKNVILPKNITAGDSYAEDQIWEVEVTIPSDMASDAEVILLNGINDKKKTDEGGFKIVGNKVYYSQSGEYLELSGVTLTSGSKYRFVREMDFNDSEAQLCSYYVYDAEGKLLGSAKKIAISTLELPVAGINMNCTGISGEALLLDNYKLYPTKVGYDFELYDEKTGMQITDLDTPRDKNIAYRFSWLNSTNKEKTYSVMAAYYEGDKLVEEKVIKEVKLAANFEGVEYGIVEVAEGQSVKVYLRNDNPADGDDTADGKGGKIGGMSTLLLIVIIAAVVVIVAVVLTLVLTGKKSKKKKKSAKKAPAKKAPAKKAEPKQDVE